MAEKHDDGISRELLRELIAKREEQGALDFESLGVELKKVLPSACRVPRWTFIWPVGPNGRQATNATVHSFNHRRVREVVRDQTSAEAGKANYRHSEHISSGA